MSDLSAIHGHARPIYDKRNRMAHFSHVYEGFTLTGVAEIEPGHPADEIGPADPEAVVYLHDLCIDGKDAADLLNPAVQEWLEEQILKESEA